jgi:hypothetical protein
MPGGCYTSAAAGILLGLASVPPAAAAGDEAWQVTPYLWAASFDGTLGTAGGGSGDNGADASFDDFWDNMSLAGAMLNVGWRRGPWAAFGDWTYARVESDSATRIPALYATAAGEVAGHILQANVGYDVLAQESGRLDLFAGVRYFDLEVQLDLAGGALPPVSPEGDDRWADVVAGLRWTTQLAPRWRAHVHADAGAGGSDLSWQLIGSIGHDYDWGSIVGGWRHLSADYDSGGYTLDAALSGPFAGAMFEF